ncbi:MULTISPECIES: SMP-30/gluconolactonase/LRE family protein [Actinomycetes]|uniref:SMP-30/gluconolactonase/LRE family protein n=1 Tax=Actinomycetes TaxID=1760 RepID=UPI0004C19DFB|nr:MULTISPECIES: SMP-30/gluconolactonase/LRE family protein [Actinomycetes]
MSVSLVDWQLDPADITLTGTGLRRPECVLAQPSGDLWIADLSGGIRHIDPDGRQDLIRPIDGGGPFAPDVNPNIDGNQGFSLPNGLCFDPDGNFVIANFGTNVIEHLTRDGHRTLIADTVIWPDGTTTPIGKANFPAFDSEGRLWFSVTSSKDTWRRRPAKLKSDGYIAVVDNWHPGSQETARVVADGLCGTNEMRFSDDGTELFVAETGADHISRFRVEPNATLTDRQIYGPDRLGGGPDGFAFDVHGNLWTTLIGADRLIAITPQGRVVTIWQDGDNNVDIAPDQGIGTTLSSKPGDGLAPRMASVTFGGPDLRTVYIGSLNGTSLPTFRSPIAGAPLAHWR